jgi:hypothetical protein
MLCRLAYIAHLLFVQLRVRVSHTRIRRTVPFSIPLIFYFRAPL